MHKKVKDSILLLSRRCKYITKPTNTLSQSSSTTVRCWADLWRLTLCSEST